jgi:hypothetical protein
MGGDLFVLFVSVVGLAFLIVAVSVAAFAYFRTPPDPTAQGLKEIAASEAATVALKAFLAKQGNSTDGRLPSLSTCKPRQ